MSKRQGSAFFDLDRGNEVLLKHKVGEVCSSPSLGRSER